VCDYWWFQGGREGRREEEEGVHTVDCKEMDTCNL